MFVVVEDEGGAVVAALPLPEGELTVGRDPGCGLLLPGERVSRRHAVLTRRGDAVSFRDLGSTLGTTVDGVRLTSGDLRPGQRLGVGGRTLRLEADPTGERLKPAPAAPAAADWRPFGAFLERLRAAAGPRELVEHLLQGLMELLGAQRGLVLLPEREGGRMVPVVTRAMSDEATVASVSGTVCRLVVERGGTVYVRDSAADEACRGTVSLGPGEPGRTVVAGPLRAGGATVGVVYLDTARAAGGVERAQLQLFETVTGLAGELLGSAETRRALLAARGRLAALAAAGAEDERLVMGDGAAARELTGLVEAAASQDVTVLITGETGTGKEMVARAIHRLSRRRGEPFVAVNCAALPRELVAAELFGVERGAFTGAVERRPGRFELASPGTLFLDELGELPTDVQTTLLRVLQERTVQRVGGTTAVPLDFRLVAATNADLEGAVRAGTFRQDLYYRVNVFRVPLRPLRERPEDLMPLARAFLERFARQFNRRLRGFAPEAEALIRAYPWPGNVRELRNAVERAAVVERGDVVSPASLPVSPAAALPPGGVDGAVRTLLEVLPRDYQQARNLFEGAFLKRLMEEAEDNIAEAGRRAGMSRCAIYRRLEQLGLLPPEGRGRRR